MTTPTQAQIMREALEKIATEIMPNNSDERICVERMRTIADAALTAAAEMGAGEPFSAEGYRALPEYDPETIERCAQVAEAAFKRQDGTARAYIVGEHISAAIRKLKDGT